MSIQGRATGKARLPVPMRDRRPALAALALLLVVVGALGSALIAYRSGDRADVLITRTDISPGHKMTAADFDVARIAGDANQTVPASAKANFIGSYAVGTIPSGSLVNHRMFTKTSIIPGGAETVGLQVGGTERPGPPLHAGDVVRIYPTPEQGTQSTTSPQGTDLVPLVQSARVVDVVNAVASSNNSTTTVTVLLSASDAKIVIPWATAGKVAVSLLPSGTKPIVDFAIN
jgi:hypothetical protein